MYKKYNNVCLFLFVNFCYSTCDYTKINNYMFKDNYRYRDKKKKIIFSIGNRIKNLNRDSYSDSQNEK